MLAAAGGLLIGALFIWIGLHLWRDGRELRRSGVTVTAKVQEKYRKTEDRSWGGLENYYIRCVFTGTDGQTNAVELKVQSKQWRQLTEQGPVKLTWLPGQPDSVKLGPRWGRKLRGAIGFVMIAIGGISVVVFPLGGLLDFLRRKT